MGVEAQYEKGFCLMLTLFSHINAHIGSRPHSILRTSSDTLIVLSRARSGSLLRQDLGTREALVPRTAASAGLGSPPWAPLPSGTQGHRPSPTPVSAFQKTGNAVRAIGRLSSMAMISGLSGRKSSTGSPTSPLNAEKLESEGKELQKGFLPSRAGGLRGILRSLFWGWAVFWKYNLQGLNAELLLDCSDNSY